MNKLDSFLEATDEKLRENLSESTKFYSIQHSESGTISEISSTTHSLQLGSVDESFFPKVPTE